MAKHTLKIKHEKLRSAIRAKYMSVKGFATKVDVKVATFRTYLNGSVDMPYMLLEKCADVLDLEPEDLIDAGETIEYEFRKSLLTLFNESEFKRQWGERNDMEHLQVAKGVAPYIVPKKAIITASLDGTDVAQRVRDILDGAIEGEVPDDVDSESAGLFELAAETYDE